MVLAEEKATWILQYLTGKIVRIMDLKGFFIIQNDNLKVVVKKVSDNKYSYTLKDYVFTVTIEEVEKPKSSYRVIAVSYEERGGEENV